MSVWLTPRSKIRIAERTDLACVADYIVREVEKEKTGPMYEDIGDLAGRTVVGVGLSTRLDGISYHYGLDAPTGEPMLCTYLHV